MHGQYCCNGLVDRAVIGALTAVLIMCDILVSCAVIVVVDMSVVVVITDILGSVGVCLLLLCALLRA